MQQINTLSPIIKYLDWHKNAAEYWFSALSSFPWSMLLHSGYTNYSCYGRFDILVADPIGTLVTYGNTTQVSLQNHTFSSLEDPLILLSQIIKKTYNFHIISNSDIPFQGGALGLFGYDLVRCFEKLPENALCDIHIPDMAIGLYDWTLIVDHFKKKVLLLSYFNIDARFTWLKTQKKTTCLNFRLTNVWRSNMNAKEYEKKFKKVKTYIRNGDCYQVNLSQRFQASYVGDEWQAFIRLNIKNLAPFSAFLRLEEGVILSFSPERFIKLCNGEIQTRPIKGTLPRLLSPKLDHYQAKRLLNSSKDRSENLMIVDLMRNDIGRVAEPGSVKVPELFKIESFPSVHHLVSTIIARLSLSFNACDLLRASFPGGSITGAPKIRAMEIIDELEPNRRNAWCGSIGYLSACGTMDTSITIRTLIAYNGNIYCSAGGGVIADSEVKSEYQETFNKVSHILQQLKK